MYIVLILALVASGIFLIQFILSMIGSDIDSGIDVDISDGSGFDFSDIISFKGIVHFLMGSCWTLYNCSGYYCIKRNASDWNSCKIY